MAAIGNTPLFRLEQLALPDAAGIDVKWNGTNPTGSMKERMALSMSPGRRLAHEEGIFGGITSGANVGVAIQRARA